MKHYSSTLSQYDSDGLVKLFSTKRRRLRTCEAPKNAKFKNQSLIFGVSLTRYLRLCVYSNFIGNISSLKESIFLELFTTKPAIKIKMNVSEILMGK